MSVGTNNTISSSAIIHDNVIIGDNNFIGDNVVIYPNTTIGNNNNIFNGNIIGEFPIHTSDEWKIYNVHKSKGVIIGNDNLFHVKNLIFSGVENKTQIGNDNKILGENHIGHDVQIFNNITIYPRVIIGGYCVCLNNSNIGMRAVIHQKLIIGQYSMIGANNTITKHVFPYYITINNKIHRLNDAKNSKNIINYEPQLKHIYANVQNGIYDLNQYELSLEINKELQIYIDKITEISIQ